MERVVGYFSKTLDAGEKRLSAIEGECATIIWAVNKVKPYIIGNHFYIYTDHRALVWLIDMRN